jgi:hypothetical protein
MEASGLLDVGTLQQQQQASLRRLLGDVISAQDR